MRGQDIAEKTVVDETASESAINTLYDYQLQLERKELKEIRRKRLKKFKKQSKYTNDRGN